MTRIMYDSVTVENIPATAQMVAGYVDGHYANIHLLRAHFPHAVVVGIATSSHTDDGQVLDVEKGDATPNGAVAWVQMRRRAGAIPTVYTSLSEWGSVKEAFSKSGISQPFYWIANWDGVVSIPSGAIAKQFENTPRYDISVVTTYWPGVDPKPVTTPTPKPKPVPPKPVKAYIHAAEGDTLSGIGSRYGLSLPQIEKLNPQIANPNLIYPGETIYISGHPTSRATYVVKKGDTLYGIGREHGLTPKQIEARNPQIVNPNEIYPGDKVYL